MTFQVIIMFGFGFISFTSFLYWNFRLQKSKFGLQTSNFSDQKSPLSVFLCRCNFFSPTKAHSEGSDICAPFAHLRKYLRISALGQLRSCASTYSLAHLSKYLRLHLHTCAITSALTHLCKHLRTSVLGHSCTHTLAEVLAHLHTYLLAHLRK